MNATYTLNAEHNGIEITFDGKPEVSILESLKAIGYRVIPRPYSDSRFGEIHEIL